MKMIQELQQSVKILQNTQQQLLTYIQSLEDTIVALSDNDNDLAEYYKAQKYAKKIKRKRQEWKLSQNEDSDTSEDTNNKRRISYRFRTLQRGNKDSYFKIATKEQNQSNNEINSDQTI